MVPASHSSPSTSIYLFFEVSKKAKQSEILHEMCILTLVKSICQKVSYFCCFCIFENFFFLIPTMDIGKIHQQQTYFEDCFKIKLVDIFGKSTFFFKQSMRLHRIFFGCYFNPILL